ncbi:MAG: SDR family NAD(P)-dependent oxidoreductase [Geminicoccaceae bacterium]
MSQSRDHADLAGHADPDTPKTVLITGASSGIGKALALNYAAAGRRLFLQGRNVGRLNEVASVCTEAGADVHTKMLDVTDRAAMAAWIEAADRRSCLDLVIANAGVSGRSSNDPDPVRTMFRVNVEGVLNTVEPVLPALLGRGCGHIALVSSLAGFRGMPTAPGYTASKAAVRTYGEGLRGKLMGQGIAVSVICPGFVKTSMTDANPFPMPLMMTPERAASIIRRGLDRRAARIAFPFRLYLAMRLVAALPPAWVDPLLQRFQGKE